MNIGDEIIVNGNKGKLIEIKDDYGLFEYSFGKFVHNLKLIQTKEIKTKRL